MQQRLVNRFIAKRVLYRERRSFLELREVGANSRSFFLLLFFTRTLHLELHQNPTDPARSSLSFPAAAMRLSPLPISLALALLFQSTVAESSSSSLSTSNPLQGGQKVVGTVQRFARVRRQDTTGGLPSTGGTDTGGSDSASSGSGDTSEQPASSAAADPATTQQQATTSQTTTQAQTSAAEQSTTQQQPTSSTQPPATSQPGEQHSLFYAAVISRSRPTIHEGNM